MGKLEDMDVFARVVTSGSLSAAGRELGLSPAGVSKRLKRLEDTTRANTAHVLNEPHGTFR